MLSDLQLALVRRKKDSYYILSLPPVLPFACPLNLATVGKERGTGRAGKGKRKEGMGKRGSKVKEKEGKRKKGSEREWRGEGTEDRRKEEREME